MHYRRGLALQRDGRDGMTAPDQPSSLAARISTIADGHAGTLDLTALRLQLIDEALARGLTWAQLGTLYGMTGPELKRDIHKLRAKVRREQLTLGCPP